MGSIVEIIIRTIDEATGGNGNIIGSFTELQSAIGLGKEALDLIQGAYNQTVGAAAAYADQVGQLSRITGMSTESSSRLLDVTDKMGVEFGQLETALRFMSKNGVEPSIQGIAQLSDQYRALSDPIDRNNFLIKEFGRSGLDMAMLMNQGSAAIERMAGETNKYLLLSQQQYDASVQNKIATKEFNEAIEAQKIALGNELMPTLTKVLNYETDWMNALEQAREEGVKGYFQINQRAQAIMQEAEAARAATSANQDNTAALRDQAGAAQLDSEALAAMSNTYQTTLNLAASLRQENGNYNKQLGELMAKQSDEEQQLKTLAAQGWSPLSQKVQDVKKQYNDTAESIDALQEQHHQAIAKMEYDLLVAKLSADGLTSSEFDMAQQVGVSLGVFTQAEADQAKAYNKVTDAAAAGKLSAEQLKGALDDVANGNYNIDLNFVSNGLPPILQQYQIPQAGQARRYQHGGSFIVPPEYGNEGFSLGGMATASGGERIDISPAGGGSKEIHLHVEIAGGVIDPQMAALQLTQTFKYLIKQENIHYG